MYLRLHCIRVVWHTKIHLLQLLSDVRLLTLVNFLCWLGIIAGFRTIVGRLTINNLVWNLNLLLSLTELRVLQLRICTLAKLHLNLLIVLRMSRLLIKCLLFIVINHSW
jgi:hypothetical protein